MTNTKTGSIPTAWIGHETKEQKLRDAWNLHLFNCEAIGEKPCMDSFLRVECEALDNWEDDGITEDDLIEFAKRASTMKHETKEQTIKREADKLRQRMAPYQDVEALWDSIEQWLTLAYGAEIAASIVYLAKLEKTMLGARFDSNGYVFTVNHDPYMEGKRVVYRRSAQFQDWVYGEDRAERIAKELQDKLCESRLTPMTWAEAIKETPAS